MKKKHLAIMCKTLEKVIWDKPISYQDDLINEKIQFVFSYTTNLNYKDYNFEAIQKICNAIIAHEFKLEFNGEDIDVIEFDLEADGNYSFRFSTAINKGTAPNELAYEVNYDSGFHLTKLDISKISLDNLENIPNKTTM